ncbi:MAG: lipopolysaccharide kinase InaA family protein [Azoarcus sp.]|jgi:tRNA A-37 threonylcarbamoyl transferase component Bud32|nr:lipopolysaccharide kinase InaA family protein [Azoarcus sp.]
MKDWWFDSELNGGVAGRAFASLEQVFALSGKLITKDALSEVVRVECEGRCYYVKRYAGNGKSMSQHWFGLRQWLSPLRVRTEWKNLQAFQKWGIPTAQLAAYGIERRYGGFRRGALVTEEIRETSDLAQLARQNDARLRNGHWLAQVSTQVVWLTQRMHDAGFAHNDLKWRNLLVSNGEIPIVYLIDCPKGGFWWGPFLRYRIVKDLACLDKVAKYHLSRTRRLRFYLDYTGHARLSEDDKRRVRHIIGFFEGRE